MKPLSARIGKLHINQSHQNSVFDFDAERKVINFNTVNGLLEYLLVVSDHELIPEHVAFDYEQILLEGDIKDVTKTIQHLTNLAYHRLTRKNKEVPFGIITHSPISEKIIEGYKKNGILGIGPSIRRVGFVESKLYWNNFWRSGGGWPKELIINDRHKNTNDIHLTYRQEQIATLIIKKGMTNEEISQCLNISVNTVKMHTGIILKKYCVKNRMQLVMFHKI